MLPIPLEKTNRKLQFCGEAMESGFSADFLSGGQRPAAYRPIFFHAAGDLDKYKFFRQNNCVILGSGNGEKM